MEEWSTYRIRDFLLFSEEILLEVVDAYNHDLWPWQILWLGLAILILVLILFPNRLRLRLVFGLLAAAWAWVGFVFHLQYFLPINWAARYSAGIFLAESLLFALSATFLGKLQPDASGPRRNLGLVIFALSAFVPLEFVFGQNISHIMVFGWGPDRTALGTIGLLLTFRQGWWTMILMLPAVIWCVLALLMYYGLS